VRRGAASCRAVLGNCPVAAAVRAAAQVPSPRSRRGWPSAPRRRDPGEVGPPSGCRRSRRCPDAGQAGRCPVRLVRSAVGMSVQPVERTSSIHVSGVQASGASRCPDGQASGVRGAVAALSAPRWTRSGSCGEPPRPGAAGRRAPVVRGRRWPCLAHTRIDRSPGPPLGRRPGCGVACRRADTGAGLGPGAGRVAGEHGTEQVFTGPGRASWAGRRRSARPWAWTKR
jgi:hypothetical protein